MIEVKNLVKRYGDHTAVNNLSFTVEKGQIYGFLGPNGAGKSTTMNIMTGYIASTEGEVYINGHNILDEPEEAKKCIGYLPEMPPLYTDMTVREYLAFAAELKGIDKKERDAQINQAMEITKLMEVQGRLIRNISKGYKQRVGLAQAILGFPEIIILDEPTVGLDPKQIIEIRDLIKELAQNHTVILSSHILSEVSAVCDYVMIIAHGELVASDTPENLSKLMLGSNTLELTVKGDKEQIQRILDDIDGINEMEIHDSTEKEAVDVVVKTDQKVDIREELFYHFASAECPILLMKFSNMSLEDVFLELTADKKPAEQKKRNLLDRVKDRVGRKRGDDDSEESVEEASTDEEEPEENEAETEPAEENEPEAEKEENHAGDI